MSFAISLRSAPRPEAMAAPAPAPAPEPAAAAPGRHFAALDGLRGLAILAVVALHASGVLKGDGWARGVRAALAPGYLGVTLFFVLSGFLITRILVQTRGKRDYFPTFFLRRSLRIFPLYFAYLSFVILVYYALKGWLAGQPYAPDAHLLRYFTYINNVHWDSRVDPGLAHLWSLAIEEQFYMAWPFVVFFVPRRWLIPACLVGFVASLGCRVAMVWAGCDAETIYASTPARVDALLIGAAVGVVELHEAARRRLVRALRPIALACLAAIAALATRSGLAAEDPLVMTAGWSVLAVFFAAVVFWAATAGATNRLLNAGWLRGIGRYSYGIYVLHVLPLLILPKYVGTATLAQQVASLAACLVATALMTAFSWRVVEAPFLRRKRQLAAA